MIGQSDAQIIQELFYSGSAPVNPAIKLFQNDMWIMVWVRESALGRYFPPRSSPIS